MADAPATSKSSFGFLGRKLGPVPIWLIGLVAVGGYYWYTHYGPGATPATAATPTAGVPAENITVNTPPGSRGPAGPRGPRGPAGKPPAKRKARRVTWRPAPAPRVPRGRQQSVTARPSFAAAPRGPAPPVQAPAAVAAPMTAGDIYGSLPTAMPDGSTYDSGDVASTMGAAYAVAG